MSSITLPDLLTVELPGAGGVCRERLEDFYVEEIPAYAPSGSGQHTLFEIEKRGIDTLNAIRMIASQLGIPSRGIGLAGLKDAQAVSRQHLSVEGIAPERVMALRLPQVTVLWADKHRNRLKIGHLRGNRFTIRIRHVDAVALSRAERIIQELSKRGMPNGFGAQRFGSRGITHLLGRALLRDDLATFFDIYLGQALPLDSDEMRAARELYSNGDIEGALRRWPLPHSEEFRALNALYREKSLKAAYHSLPHELLRLTGAAYQSYLFNRMVQQRLPALGQLETGDLAYKHINGASFLVEDALVEQPRADSLEISPTAPLFGRKVRLAEGAPGIRERELMEEENLTPQMWHTHSYSLDGSRRPLRVPLGEPSVCEDGDSLVLRFSLPAGAFASNLLREVMKTPDAG